MNVQFLFLYLLSTIAAFATSLRMNQQTEPTLFDWIAFASLAALMTQALVLLLKLKMWS